MSISPLIIAGIVVGLLVVVVIVVLLAGGAAWLVLRKKPKAPANRQASAARTPPGPAANRLPSRPQKPAYPAPAKPLKPPAAQHEALPHEAWPPQAAKLPPLAVIEIVDKEQERVAEEMSGAAKNWKSLFADAFDHGAQENPASAGGIPAPQNTIPDAQILVDTLNNTAKDVSGAIAGLAEAGSPASKPRLPGIEKTVAFLDLYVDLVRQLSALVQGELDSGSNLDADAYAWFTFAAPAPRLAPSLTGSPSGDQAVPSGIVNGRPATSGASMVSLSQAVQQVTQARQTAEKAYQEVLSSLGYGTSLAGYAGGSTLARGFDKAKEMLSGGS